MKGGEIEMGIGISERACAELENCERTVARCTQCGEIAGEGEKCDECSKVRIARNQPQPDTFAGCRLPAEQVKTSPRWKSGAAPAAAIAGATEKERGQEKQEAVEMKKYDCANPAKNPQCSGVTAKPGGLCRSCGIRAGKAAKAGVSGAPRTGRFKCASGCGEPVGRDGAYCTGCAGLAGERKPAPGGNRGGGAAEPREIALTSGATVPRPRAVAPPTMPPGAAEGPGPLTAAVCDFVAACYRASDRVEASLVLEHRQMTIQVKFALPN